MQQLAAPRSAAGASPICSGPRKNTDLCQTLSMLPQDGISYVDVEEDFVLIMCNKDSTASHTQEQRFNDVVQYVKRK